MITVYGIANCDTVKRARAWLGERGIAHKFHDYRKDGLDRALLEGWVAELGHETLVNRRGTTWRGLPEADKADLDASRAVALMLAHPALIKRPLFDLGESRLVGFTPAVQEALAARA